jgi:hypothetical protein
MNFRQFFTAAFTLTSVSLFGQITCWQQRVEYAMDVKLQVKSHQYQGSTKLVYYNESPDALNRVFFHLYNNAFQPNSAMDIQSRSIADPDWRVGDRISQLTPEEQGYLHVKNLKMNGKVQSCEENETILEVTLDQPIAPHSKVTFEFEFNGQMPLQIRRNGRDNAEGIEYSMSQWYPKMCEYDVHGWHANPYIGREFYGVWGDFNVNITLDKDYVVAAGAILQNPEEVGYGYCSPDKVKKQNGKELTWKFQSKHVHDFAWAADPDYAHDQYQVPDGPMLHFFYQKGQAYEQAWKDLQPLAAKAFTFLSANYGKYPYPVYNVIQAGDGGMEYPMATLISGDRKLPSLVGVTVHEGAHSWYYGLLGSNESRFSWMDEGFTSYATQTCMDELFQKGTSSKQRSAYSGYIEIVKSGQEEALDTHADHFITNYAYGTAAYDKGAVYLSQLEYIMGTKPFKKGILDYFDACKYKHPDNYDFIRCMEKASDMELDWYNEYFVNTTKTIDYSISQVTGEKNRTEIQISRTGLMPMPVDVSVEYKDGRIVTYTIPMDIQRGAKKDPSCTILPDWRWVEREYTIKLDVNHGEIKTITIDSSELMADVNREDNSVDLSKAGSLLIIRK